MAKSTSDYSVPSDINGLFATPVPFNTEKRGENAILSGDGSVVERLEPEDCRDGGVAYTESPLPLGQVWQTTVLNTTERHGGLGLVRLVDLVFRFIAYIFEVASISFVCTSDNVP